MLNTGSKQFQTWFGSSKVVNDLGLPLEVYRGDCPGKTAFSGCDDAGSRLQGNAFFSSSAWLARNYTVPRPSHMTDVDDINERHGFYRVYLSIQNPLCVDAKDEDWSRIPLNKSLAKRCGAVYGTLQIDDLAVASKKMGHDGLIVRNVLDQYGFGDQFVTFKPDHVFLIQSNWLIQDADTVQATRRLDSAQKACEFMSHLPVDGIPRPKR